MSECRDGVEPRGLPRRPQARYDRDYHQEHSGRHQRHRIGRTGLEQLISEQPPNAERSAQPERQTEGQVNQPAPQNQPAHLLRLCAERHPQADFLSALRHRICSDREQSDGRQHNGDAGEDREHRSEHAGEPAHLSEVLIHRADVVQRQVRIHGEHLFSKKRCQRSRIRPSSHDDRRRADKRRILTVWNVYNRIRCGIVLRAALTYIWYQTDDRRPLVSGRIGRVVTETDPLPDRLRVSKVHGREALIDDGDLPAWSSFGRIERAAASSTIVSASSTTTRAAVQRRARRPPDPERPASFNTSLTLVFEMCSAGARPKTIPVRRHTTPKKAKTLPSISNAIQYGLPT